MNREIMRIFAPFVLCILISAQSWAGEPTHHLTILTENAGEANHVDGSGKTVGHNVDIVKELMKRTGRSFEIEVVPWARGYLMAQNDPDTALFSTIRTPERDDLFKWVGPLHFIKYILFAKKDYPTAINNLEDARKVVAIGCVAEDIGQKILLKKGFKNLDPYFGTKANIQNMKKLLAGRIDLWFSSKKEVGVVASQLGIDPSELKETIVVAEQFAYIAFSKKTPDAIVERWQKALDDMKNDGTYEKIMTKYPNGSSSMTFERPAPVKE